MKQQNLDNAAKKAGTGYVLGNFILKGCAFLSLPFFTKLLTTADFGIYNTYIAYEGILAAILGLGFYGTIKNAKIKYHEDFDGYVSSILSFSCLFFVLIIIASNLLYPLFANLLGYSRFVINILVCQSFGTALLQVYSAKLNMQFKYKSFLAFSLANTLGNICLSFLLILFVFNNNDRYLGRILGTAAPLIVIGLIILVISFVSGKKFASIDYWRYALRLGLPLLPHVIAQSLLSQVDRIMISNLVGESEAGVYSFVYTLCTILAVVATSLDNAWTPWVYTKIGSSEQDSIRKPGNSYLLFFALITFGFVCVMPEIASLFGSGDYLVGIDLIVPLSLANFFIFAYFLPVNIEYFNNKTFFISIGTVLAALLNLALNLLFIHLFGYKGAAYTTLISYFLLFFVHCLISKKYGFMKIYDFKFIVLVSLLLIMACFGVLAIYKTEVVLFVILRYVFAALVVVFIIFFYKKYIHIRQKTH